MLSWLREEYPNIALIWADGGYANSVDACLVGWADQELGVEGDSDPRSRRVGAPADPQAHGGRTAL